MSRRENILKAVRFETPEYIPMSFHINGACWNHYPHDALFELKESHPFLFPGFTRPEGEFRVEYSPWQRAGEPYIDPWGCVWETAEDGITGAVVKHSLETWDDFDGYTPPDPEQSSGWAPVDWKKKQEQAEKIRAAGGLVRGGLRHGHTFLTLTYIRGYENLVFDMTDEEPRLWKLIGMVEDYNMTLVRHFMDIGVDYMGYPEDLGMQVGPMLSPAQFKKYIKPTYERLMAPAREAGCIVHMHSDGDIRDLVDDLIDGGVQVVNLQDLANGIDWIREHLTGKVCVDLDVDRQRITRFGSPQEIDALIREEVEKLGSREGGLMMIHGMYPGVPLENAKALMDAMENYATYYS
jgi:hypothetical protein